MPTSPYGHNDMGTPEELDEQYGFDVLKALNTVKDELAIRR